MKRALACCLSLLLWPLTIAASAAGESAAIKSATAETAVVNASFKSKEDVTQWMTFYYQQPEPEKIPDAIQYLSESDMLDKNSAPPVFGFLSGVFRDNPDKVATWINQIGSYKEHHLTVLVLGVWYAALPQSKEIAQNLLEKYPASKTQFTHLLKSEPITVEQIPIQEGPWVLDALWGKFLATGDSAPVERIISAVPWVNVKGDVNRLLVGGAARWSLTSNAVQHKRVLEICEKAEKTQSAEVAKELAKIIKKANEPLKIEQKPTGNANATP